MNNKDINQIYQNTFNEIHASTELLRKVKNMSVKKQKKKFNFKIITTLAACLVALIVGTTIINSISGNGNTFILKTSAAEIGSDSLIKIATVSPTGGYTGSIISGENKEIYMGSISPFTVICNGKNIKTIKYTIYNAVFLFPYNSYAKNFRNVYSDVAVLSDKIYNKVYAEQKIVNGVEENDQYISYMLNYDDQAELEKYTDLQTFPIQISALISTNDNISYEANDALKNYMSVTPEFETENNYSLSDKEYISDLMTAFQIVYDEIYSKIHITVEVTYEDGTSDTETLRLGCETVNEKEGIIIGAKVLDNR